MKPITKLIQQNEIRVSAVANLEKKNNIKIQGAGN